MRRWSLLVLMLSLGAAVQAGESDPVPPAFSDPRLATRFEAITRELRCLVCQNQTIADSHAPLAVDLRREVHAMLERGATDQQVIEFMTQRYGDFVLYRPPVQRQTALLWFGPALLLGLGALVLVGVVRQRARLPDGEGDA
jgi:cytochrome c-type biogenesis protein CcmH